MKNNHALFVCGIGTGVGKTVASAILTELFKADYWKPVQAGDLENGDKHKVEKWISNDVSRIFPETYALPYPLSPHASAEKAGIELDVSKIVLPETRNQLIIEGAGGLMVPLTYDKLYIEWVHENNLPVILISRHYLGSINHTLMSIECLKIRNIQIEGILFNGELNKESEKVIEKQGDIRVLGRIDASKKITKKFIKAQAEKLKMNEYFGTRS
jgi:dethiobiotin synthetase